MTPRAPYLIQVMNTLHGLPYSPPPPNCGPRPALAKNIPWSQHDDCSGGQQPHRWKVTTKLLAAYDRGQYFLAFLFKSHWPRIPGTFLLHKEESEYCLVEVGVLQSTDRRSFSSLASVRANVDVFLSYIRRLDMAVWRPDSHPVHSVTWPATIVARDKCCHLRRLRSGALYLVMCSLVNTVIRGSL